MNTTTLRDFLLGRKSATELAADFQDVWEWSSRQVRNLRMVDDLGEDFNVSTSQLIRLCDAVAHGVLSPDSLEALAFGMISSGHFTWDADTVDGKRVSETLHDWSCPEVNYELTVATVCKFRHRLLSGEETFTQNDYFKGRAPKPSSVWDNLGRHPE